MDFKNKRILGMVHLSGGGGDSTIQRALNEIKIYEEEGLYGCIIENYHGSIADVEAVLKALPSDRTILIGINILPNEYALAFNLANTYNADFIQLDFISGQYKINKKIDLSDYNQHLSTLNPNIKVFGGVWPKYYIPADGSDLKSDITEAIALCDGIVVTGAGTGKETPLDKIKQFKEFINDDSFPLIIGAGLDASNVVEQLTIADGAIVGSCFKPYKRTQEMVSRELVKEFMLEVKKVVGEKNREIFMKLVDPNKRSGYFDETK